MTPTQRSLEYLREQGYLCAVVEKWNPHARIRQDLWGWCDILAIRKNEVLAVQVTASGVSDRIKKITASETVGPVREAGTSLGALSVTSLSLKYVFSLTVKYSFPFLAIDFQMDNFRV